MSCIMGKKTCLCSFTEIGLYIEWLFYLCSENKGTDQLRDYRAADPAHLFLHIQKAGFLMTWFKF